MSKISNAKLQSILDRYLSADFRGLYNCYKKPSFIKQSIYDNFIRTKINNGGKDLKIVSFTPMIFTIGFVVEHLDENKEYDYSVLFYDTPMHHYEIPFDKRDGKISV